MITIHAQLIDGEVREMGYIIYVFKNLEPSDPKEVYKLVTRWPNWNHRDLKLGEIGYLTYNDVESGRTEWYNPNTKTMELYRTRACEFISFIAEKKTDEQEYIM